MKIIFITRTFFLNKLLFLHQQYDDTISKLTSVNNVLIMGTIRVVLVYENSVTSKHDDNVFIDK